TLDRAEKGQGRALRERHQPWLVVDATALALRIEEQRRVEVASGGAATLVARRAEEEPAPIARRPYNRPARHGIVLEVASHRTFRPDQQGCGWACRSGLEVAAERVRVEVVTPHDAYRHGVARSGGSRCGQ